MLKNVLTVPAHYLLSDQRGGDKTVIYNIINFLSQYFNNSVLCGKSLITHAIPNTTFFQVGPTKPGLRFTWKYYKVAKRILSTKHIDLVHHMIPFGYRMTFNPLAVTGLLHKTPFVIGAINYPTINWTFHLSNELLSPLTKKLQAVTLKEAEILVFDGEQTRSIYKQTYPDILKNVKTEVIPDGVECDMFYYRPRIKRNHHILLSVCKIIERKGLQYLLEALPLILREVKNVKLVIVGDGPYKSILENTVKKLGIVNYVKFPGYIPRNFINQYYNDCDVYVHPSLNETFPSVIREAMSSGKPIVATDVGLINEHIKNGINGFLVEPCNVKELAEVIIRILSDGELRFKIGRRNRDYALTNFSYKSIGERWRQIYYDALEIMDG